MAQLPYIRDTNPGLSQSITNTTGSNAVEVPATAVGVVLWFENGTGDIISGRVGVDQDNTVVTINNTNMGFHPSMPVQYELPRAGSFSGRTYAQTPRYLHVGSSVAGAVVRGSWLFGSDAGA